MEFTWKDDSGQQTLPLKEFLQNHQLFDYFQEQLVLFCDLCLGRNYISINQLNRYSMLGHVY